MRRPLLLLLVLLPLSCSGDETPLANREKFIPIPDMREWHPELGFSGRTELTTDGAPIFVTDPIYLADVYNANEDPVAQYLRQHAVIVSDFGGDTSCPVWWKSPHLVLPVSFDAGEDAEDAGDWGIRPPPGATVLAQEIGCDSASFVFLVLRDDLPEAVRARVDAELSNGAVLNLPVGTYRFHLEQSRPPAEHAQWPHWYRNIVAERVHAAS
jgi:hypothetical protein